MGILVGVKLKNTDTRFEVFTAVKIHVNVFWVMIPWIFFLKIKAARYSEMLTILPQHRTKLQPEDLDLKIT